MSIKYLIVCLLAVACHRQSGFTLKKITPRVHCIEEEPKNIEFIQSLFARPLTYVGSGNHTYAFATYDGEYVIKFFKQNHFTPYTWRDYLPLPEQMNPWRLGCKERKIAQRKQAFDSLKLAQKHLSEQTGLVYLHLGRTQSICQVPSLIYSAEYAPKCQIDKMEFVVQKKARVGFERIDECFEQSQPASAINGLIEYLRLIKTRCLKGIADQDLQFYKNFGFLGQTPIEIDIGDFSLDPEIKKNWRKEVQEASYELVDYLQRKSPEHVQPFKARLEELLR